MKKKIWLIEKLMNNNETREITKNETKNDKIKNDAIENRLNMWQ